MTEYQYWAYRSKPAQRGKPHYYGPFSTREEAIAAVFRSDEKAQVVGSGHGLKGPYFDIRWMSRKHIGLLEE